MLLKYLLDVWERSVKATHLFLSDQEVCQIRQYVPQALCSVQHLVVAANGSIPAGFMGVEGKTLEMLFLAPEERGKGLGRELLQHGIDVYSVDHIKEQSLIQKQPSKSEGCFLYLCPESP